MKRYTSIFYLLSIFIATIHNSVAEEEIFFRSAGEIHYISNDSTNITINDISYSIGSSVIVHTEKGDFIGPSYLTPNSIIGYNHENKVITEVWLIDKIPDNFISLW